MRLIDADALRKDIVELPNCSNGFSDTYDKAMILSVIDEQPTVDAVPVEFVKESIEILKFNGMLSGALLFETLLNDWKANTERKEDETS